MGTASAKSTIVKTMRSEGPAALTRIFAPKIDPAKDPSTTGADNSRSRAPDSRYAAAAPQAEAVPAQYKKFYNKNRTPLIIHLKMIEGVLCLVRGTDMMETLRLDKAVYPYLKSINNGESLCSPDLESMPK